MTILIAVGSHAIAPEACSAPPPNFEAAPITMNVTMNEKIPTIRSKRKSPAKSVQTFPRMKRQEVPIACKGPQLRSIIRLAERKSFSAK